MNKNERPGLFASCFPKKHESMGSVQSTLISAREMLVGWADEIPVLNIGADIVRLLV